MMQYGWQRYPLWRVMGVVIMLFGVAGCMSHTPPPPAPPVLATLYIVRTGGDGLSEFVPIAIDTGPLVSLTPQTYVGITVAPGLHRVTSFLGDYETTLLQMVSADQPTFVR